MKYPVKVGEKYNKLTVISLNKNASANFLCDCGEKITAYTEKVVHKNIQSCGCLRIENQKRGAIFIGDFNRTHGDSKTRFYKAYSFAKRRCIKKNDKDYSRYGGRGIKFCWGTYQEFKKDMFVSYSKHCADFSIADTTLERINVNGDYSKENCTWATRNEQSKNCQNSRKYTYKNRTLIIADWAREFNISRQALRYRLERGLSIEDSLIIPLNHGNKLNV